MGSAHLGDLGRKKAKSRWLRYGLYRSIFYRQTDGKSLILCDYHIYLIPLVLFFCALVSYSSDLFIVSHHMSGHSEANSYVEIKWAMCRELFPSCWICLFSLFLFSCSFFNGGTCPVFIIVWPQKLRLVPKVLVHFCWFYFFLYSCYPSKCAPLFLIDSERVGFILYSVKWVYLEFDPGLNCPHTFFDTSGPLIVKCLSWTLNTV